MVMRHLFDRATQLAPSIMIQSTSSSSRLRRLIFEGIADILGRPTSLISNTFNHLQSSPSSKPLLASLDGMTLSPSLGSTRSGNGAAMNAASGGEGGGSHNGNVSGASTNVSAVSMAIHNATLSATPLTPTTNTNSTTTTSLTLNSNTSSGGRIVTRKRHRGDANKTLTHVIDLSDDDDKTPIKTEITAAVVDAVSPLLAPSTSSLVTSTTALSSSSIVPSQSATIPQHILGKTSATSAATTSIAPSLNVGHSHDQNGHNILIKNDDKRIISQQASVLPSISTSIESSSTTERLVKTSVNGISSPFSFALKLNMSVA
jgi:hypothetical protein